MRDGLKKLVVMWMAAAMVVLPVSGAQMDPAREYAGSMVMSQYGIVATLQAVASQAGAQILAKGGNAVDAAIAANAALGVVEPMMNGVGGDLFAMVYINKDKKLYGLNSSGWAPKELTIAALKAKGLDHMRTIDEVTVPGTVAGWVALHDRWGKLPLAVDLAPAVALATEGFGVPTTDAENWATYGMPFAKDAEFARVYLPGGKAPAAGELFKNAELAATLKRIGEQGRDGFYKGPVAEAILKLERRLGGFMQADDLADFEPQWQEPISTTYHGWTVYEMPPNGQGEAALAMLNLMERYPIAAWGHNSAKALHVEIEAKKLAYADLARYVGDPRATDVPTAELISKELAAKRAELIGPEASCHVLPSDLKTELQHQASDTTYLATVDKDGNEVSLIQSNAGAFGGGLVAPGMGFVLQNRGAGFTLRPDRANTLRPRTRPLHTIIPAFMTNGKRKIAFGIMGGFNQAQAHAQFVSNVVDFGMNIQAALGAARFTKRDFAGCDLMMEDGIPEKVIAALDEQGNVIRVLPRYSQTMGRGNAVEVDVGNPVHFGATDPRADGLAVPQELHVQRQALRAN